MLGMVEEGVGEHVLGMVGGGCRGACAGDGGGRV